MRSMQITSFFQIAVTVISVALYFGVLCEALAHDLLQGLSFEVVHSLRSDEQGYPVLRLGYCCYSLDLICSPTALSVMGGTANIVIIHLYNAGKLVMPVSLLHSLADSL